MSNNQLSSKFQMRLTAKIFGFLKNERKRIKHTCGSFFKKRKICSPGIVLNSQSGNTLFYVLIAVALLAALSYAVSQSGRGSAKQVSKERAKLIASEIIEYSNSIAAATAQLRLRGYSDTEISYDTLLIAGSDNPKCADNACEVLNVSGGGIIAQQMSAEAGGDSGVFNFRTQGNMEIENIGSTCGAAQCSDLIFLARNVNETVCMQINELLGIENPSDSPPDDSTLAFTQFVGVYSYEQTIGDEAGGSGLASQSAGCVTSTFHGSHNYYKVLIAR